MAAVASYPRPLTSVGMPKQRRNLPVIEHPNSRLGDRGSLTVRGNSGLANSRAGSVMARGGSVMGGREKTFVALEASGKVHTGLERSSLPPLGGGSSPTPGSATMRPGPSYESHQKQGKYNQPVGAAHKYAQHELESLLADKVATAYHGLQHLFRSNDPTGQGVISREAFQRILYSLVGYITNDQFQKLLHSLGLENRTHIKFENFIGCFRENESSKREWVSPVQKLTVRIPSNKDESLRSEFSHRDGFISGAYALTLMKEHFKNKRHQISDYLPSTCYTEGGMVVWPHVHEIIVAMDIKLTEEEQHRMWSRIDYDNTGAVKTGKFFKLLGLDDNGHPRPTTTATSYARRDRHKQATHLDIKEEPALPSYRNDDSGDTKRAKKTTVKVGKKATPRLNRAIDCLLWKFEESYNALEMGLKCFDFLGDGYISRIDLKRVFDEFGMPVGVIELEHFLSRCCIRTSHGQIPYKELMMKFWNKAESGLTNRIVNNKHHIFSLGISSLQEGEPLNVEQLEAKLIEFLHGDYLKLMSAFKRADKFSIGVVTQHEFREAVERALGYSMSASQWEDLLQTAGQDKDGLVPYAKFMEKFNVSPGSWNHKDLGNFKVQQAPSLLESPPEIESLKFNASQETQNKDNEARIEEERKKREEEKKREKKEKEQNALGRPLNELTVLVGEILQKDFYGMDKVFKSIDRRMTGRFNRWQFCEMLKQCGLMLIQAELDRLWSSFPLGADNMFTFTTLVRHFMERRQLHPDLVPQSVKTDENNNVTCKQVKIAENITEIENPNPAEQDTSASPRPQVPRSPDLLQKIKPQIAKHWEQLKAIFRHLDKMGTCHIMSADLLEVLKTMHITSSDVEARQIVEKFDPKHTGRFNYIDFLKTYADNSRNDGSFIYNKVSHKLEKKATVAADNIDRQNNIIKQQCWHREETNPTIRDAEEHIRVKLLKDHKNIRRAFRKYDSSGKGYLTVADFKNVLAACNIKVGPEDLYFILSEFDSTMNGKISYEQFMAELMSAC